MSNMNSFYVVESISPESGEKIQYGRIIADHLKNSLIAQNTEYHSWDQEVEAEALFYCNIINLQTTKLYT